MEKALEDLKNYRALSVSSKQTRGDGLFAPDATDRHLGQELGEIITQQIELLKFQVSHLAAIYYPFPDVTS